MLRFHEFLLPGTNTAVRPYISHMCTQVKISSHAHLAGTKNSKANIGMHLQPVLVLVSIKRERDLEEFGEIWRAQ